MAAKTKRKLPQEILPDLTYQMPQIETSRPKKKKWILILLLVAGALALFWYKTDTWPVVAFVNGRPITRYEVNNLLYKQQGALIVDNLITRKLISQELSRQGVKVPQSEVDDRVTEVKSSLEPGQELDQLLAARGMTMTDLTDQIKMQLGIEKALGDKVQVSGDEIDKFIGDNTALFPKDSSESAKKELAVKSLKDQKFSVEFGKWLDEVRKSAKIWWVSRNSASVIGQ